MAIHSLVDFDELNLHQALAERPLDFDFWTSLISNVETKFSGEIDKLSLVYDSFLSDFPLCCGYWRKYVGHKVRLCSVEEVVGVYEKAVESASFSVDIWVDYCCFAILIFEDPSKVSRLFRRGLSFIGRDYMCDALWDKYIEFEDSQKQWSSLSHIYIDALKCPTKKLHQYYDSFKKLVAILEEETGCHDESIVKSQSETRLDEEFAPPEDDEVSCIINALQKPSTIFEALKKYSSIGERLYQKASQLDRKIDSFEKNILRTHFHVKPLDDEQLQNWHHYLDFVERTKDFDWAVKLYERCLIPCARYSEFWMRYVDYLESKGGREIANDALERATKTFLKDSPAIHLFDAGFKEKIGDVCGARTALLDFDMHSESSFIDHAIRRANMEKRVGNNLAASNVYKEALAVATKDMPNALSPLYIHYSRLEYTVTNSVDAARDILIGGIQTVANCKLLLEELITLVVHHEGAHQLNILDPIVADSIIQGSDVSRGLSYEDKLHISELYLKFIDLCGTIHDSRKAWNRHIKLFPRSLRLNSTCMQPARASSRRKIFTVGLGTNDTAFVKPKELTKIDDISPLIQRSADIAEDMKEAPYEEVTRKADKESCELVHKAADFDLMEDDKNNKENDEQLYVSGRDEPPSMDILSLNEPNNEPHNLNSSTDQGCQEASSSGMLEGAQKVEPQPSSSLFNAQASNSDQGYCKSSTNASMPSMRGPQCEDKKQQEWVLSPSHHGSPRRQSPGRHPEDQKHKEWSVSPPRDGTPRWPEGQHHENRSHHSQRHHSRWSLVEQGEEQQPHSQRQRFAPDGRGGHSIYSDRHRQNRPTYYDNSKGQRGRRMQNARRGRDSHPRRGQYVHNQGFTSTSQMQPSAQPSGYPSSGQYPAVQSSEQYANMQSSQSYDQMWQYYYYYQQQQQQLMLMQQQQAQPQQQLPESQQQLQLQQKTQDQPQSQPQSQQQLQMQLLQFQYQQQQQQLLQLQSQMQHQDVSKQPQPDEKQQQANGDLQTQQQQQQLYQQMQQQQQQLYHQMQQQQQQLYQQMQLHGQQPQQEQSNQAAQAQQQQQQWQAYQYQQQQYLLYLQQMQQQPGAQVLQQQVISAEKEVQNELQLQQEPQLLQKLGEQQDGSQQNEVAPNNE